MHTHTPYSIQFNSSLLLLRAWEGKKNRETYKSESETFYRVLWMPSRSKKCLSLYIHLALTHYLFAVCMPHTHTHIILVSLIPSIYFLSSHLLQLVLLFFEFFHASSRTHSMSHFLCSHSIFKRHIIHTFIPFYLKLFAKNYQTV